MSRSYMHQVRRKTDKTRLWCTILLWLIYSCAAVSCWQEPVWVGRTSFKHTHIHYWLHPHFPSLNLLWMKSSFGICLWCQWDSECSRKHKPGTTESILELHSSEKKGGVCGYPYSGVDVLIRKLMLIWNEIQTASVQSGWATLTQQKFLFSGNFEKRDSTVIKPYSHETL